MSTVENLLGRSIDCGGDSKEKQTTSSALVLPFNEGVTPGLKHLTRSTTWTIVTGYERSEAISVAGFGCGYRVEGEWQDK